MKLIKLDVIKKYKNARCSVHFLKCKYLYFNALTFKNTEQDRAF
jgi:hypothetical protein